MRTRLDNRLPPANERDDKQSNAHTHTHTHTHEHAHTHTHEQTHTRAHTHIFSLALFLQGFSCLRLYVKNDDAIKQEIVVMTFYSNDKQISAGH